MVPVGDRVKGTQAVPSETSQRPTEALTGHTLWAQGGHLGEGAHSCRVPSPQREGCTQLLVLHLAEEG